MGSSERADHLIARVVWLALAVVLVAAVAQSVIAEQYLGGRSGTFDPAAVIDRADLPRPLTWAYPLSIDGLMVVALGVAYLLRHADDDRLRRWPWAVALYAGLLSVGANFLHGPLALGLIPWPWVAAGVWSSVPAQALILGSHLVYVLKRSGERAPAAQMEPDEDAAQEGDEESAGEREETPEPAQHRRSRRPGGRVRKPSMEHLRAVLIELAGPAGDPLTVEAGDVAERLRPKRERSDSTVRRWVKEAKSTFRPGPAMSGQERAA